MTKTMPILPSKQTFAKKPNTAHELDLKAICWFVATGFFAGEDTYWKDRVCLLPGHKHSIDNKGYLIKSEPWFKWSYSPKDIPFSQALDEYIDLFSKIIKDQAGNKPVILPLSGGLDSRSQALVLKDLDNPTHGFSYSFDGGYPEHLIGEKIAKICGFTFDSYKIPNGYLWNNLEELSQINGCYSEFTHPRQMAVLPQLKAMKGVFSLGHWGDVFFDRGVPEGTTEKDIVPLLLKKMVKPKGLELAQKLWRVWSLEGDFKSYLINKIETDLSNLKIDNISAKVRAYKTSQWAHRWTTTNLSVFEAAHPITLPYYDDRVCKFICSIPEEYLADRRLQIAHLKQNKSLANITWHAQSPFNINNYHLNKFPFNLPFRVLSKIKRETNALIGKPFIQRNWELQFDGNKNTKMLEHFLFNEHFVNWIPNSVIKDTYEDFKFGDRISSSHAVSMLLTLSVWYQQNSVYKNT